ncbi:MAG: hypothetical protein U0U33_18485 [Chitinophagaceae bacterium]|nr:hypothetical protein [Panacibacter sp.]
MSNIDKLLLQEEKKKLQLKLNAIGAFNKDVAYQIYRQKNVDGIVNLSELLHKRRTSLLKFDSLISSMKVNHFQMAFALKNLDKIHLRTLEQLIEQAEFCKKFNVVLHEIEKHILRRSFINNPNFIREKKEKKHKKKRCIINNYVIKPKGKIVYVGRMYY